MNYEEIILRLYKLNYKNPAKLGLSNMNKLWRLLGTEVGGVG